jgi:hypothetical protein
MIESYNSTRVGLFRNYENALAKQNEISNSHLPHKHLI